MIDQKETPEYKPSEREEKLITTVGREWEHARELKQRPWKHLRDMSVAAFMERSRDHYNGYVPPKSEESDDWTANYFRRKTRAKVVSTVAAFLASGNGIDIGALDARERIDRSVSSVVDDIYEWSLEREGFARKLMSTVMEMVVTGTAHTQEDIVWEKRTVKEITSIDFETGAIEFEEVERVDFKGTKMTFIPNSEMFPGDTWEPDVQNQPYLIRRQQSTYEDAESAYGKYANWKFVVAGHDNFFDNSYETAESEQKDSDTDDNAVEILHRWKKHTDEYVVIINGVVVVDIPIPYPHKMYPIAKSIFEPFADQRFYWGDSLPNKNWDEQEMSNELFNMMYDSARLKNKPPLFTTNAELAHTDLIVPATIATMSPEDRIETIAQITQGVTNSDVNMLNLIEGQINENAQQSVTQNQIADADLATEIKAMVGSSERIRDFNENFLGDLLIQHARLRIPNLLWFLTKDEEYQEVVRHDVKIKGQKGSRVISFIHAAEIPSPDDIFVAQEYAKKKGASIELVHVDKDRVNDYRYFITISAVKKPTRTSASRLSKAFAKYRIYQQNEYIDQIKNTETLLEELGDQPEEWISQQPPQQQATPRGKAPSPQDTQLLTQAAKSENLSELI